MALCFRSVRLSHSQPRLARSGQLTNRRFASTFSVDNPYTGEEYVKVKRATDSDAARAVANAAGVFKSFRSTKLDDRIALCRQVMKEFQKAKQQIANDITGQMGKPLKQALGEVDGMLSRADALIHLAPRALATEQLSPVTDSAAMKKITKEPIGPVLLLSPWNYPLLCTINSTFHAVLAGNPIIIKHSDRSPLVAEAFEKAFLEAGAPAGLVQSVHADHALVSRMIANPDIAYVSFTGSVGGGRAVYKAVADRFIDVGLELGGKDGAYVARDADVKKAAAGIVDGAIYNAGQSCCAVERVYVHRDVYDPFVQECVKLAKEYVLGNPLSESTTLGPMAQPQAPAFLKKQVDEAVQKGASLLFGGKPTKSAEGKGRFFEPTVVAGCDHSMNVMVDESFGPIVAIHKPVGSDDEAVKLINDSPYGLTASVWSSNPQKAEHLCQQLDVGTVYLNRCDFLDPLLPWSGRKDSGKGIGLSHLGFAPFIRTKGYNFKNQI